MSNHTPAPWTICKKTKWADAQDVPVELDCTVIEANDCDIALVLNGATPTANAKLIAAAPELLKALETILSCSAMNEEGNDDFSIAAYDVALAAIAKATGCEAPDFV